MTLNVLKKHPHLMPEEPFKRLKQRWEESKHLIDNPEAFEPTIQRAIAAINAFPGLVTIWSCEGHPEKKGPKGRDHGYIMVGVQDIDAMYAIYAKCTERTTGQRNQFSLNMAMRSDCTLPHDPLNLVWYPVFILSWSITTRTKERTNAFLCDTCMSMRENRTLTDDWIRQSVLDTPSFQIDVGLEKAEAQLATSRINTVNWDEVDQTVLLEGHFNVQDLEALLYVGNLKLNGPVAPMTDTYRASEGD